MHNDSRGQSELLGFLLIFVVVVLTIALVSATGFVGLNNAQDYQRTTNTEGAFTVLASNIEDVTQLGAPSRSTEISITDASLSINEERSSLNISRDGEALDLGNDGKTGSIVYDSGTDTTLTYRSGALIREDSGSPVLFREPDFVITDEEVILPIVQLSAAGTSEVGGTSDVSVQAIGNGTDVVVESEPVNTNVTLVIETPHVRVWERYFQQFEADGPVTDINSNYEENTVTVEIETDRLTVTVDRVDTTFR